MLTRHIYIKAPPSDDSLAWKGITLYSVVDTGVTYQNHGALLSSTGVLGLNYLIQQNSNGSYFGVAPNAPSAWFVRHHARKHARIQSTLVK
jgi:hypothetical protein